MSLGELLAGYAGRELSADEVETFERYRALLLRWNARTNLTAVRDPGGMARRHFGESLAVAAWLQEEFDLTGKRLFDLGSGAGFPGVPIAIWCPGLQVTLIESRNKKAAFLREVCRTLELRNAAVFAGRGEEMEERADFVTMRAVERSAEMVAVGKELLVPRGTLVRMLGQGQSEPDTRTLRGGVRIACVLK